MSKDASAGEKPPAPAREDSPTNHDDDTGVVVHQTHRVTARGIDTSTTLTTPGDTQRVSEAVADQLQLAFDVDPREHGLHVPSPWSYADHALTRLGGDSE